MRSSAGVIWPDGPNEKAAVVAGSIVLPSLFSMTTLAEKVQNSNPVATVGASSVSIFMIESRAVYVLSEMELGNVKALPHGSAILTAISKFSVLVDQEYCNVTTKSPTIFGS